MRYEVRAMMYVGMGEWVSELVDSFDSYNEAEEFNGFCHENGLNTFVREV